MSGTTAMKAWRIMKNAVWSGRTAEEAAQAALLACPPEEAHSFLPPSRWAEIPPETQVMVEVNEGEYEMHSIALYSGTEPELLCRYSDLRFKSSRSPRFAGPVVEGEGIEGHILETPDGVHVFRVYAEDRSYTDYDLTVDDLRVVLAGHVHLHAPIEGQLRGVIDDSPRPHA